MIMLSGEKNLEKKVVDRREAMSDYSVVSSVDSFLIWNVTEERELFRRGTCENPGWMKDLYRYRKEVIPWR